MWAAIFTLALLIPTGANCEGRNYQGCGKKAFF